MAHSDQSCQMFRVILEAMLPSPALLVVSSASGEDGQTELACRLADAFGDAGRKTALISLYRNGDAHDRSLSEIDPRTFAGSFFRAPFAITEMDALIADVRAEHEIVIVVTPPIVSESASLHLCRLADGVLLAVRLGRKVTAADEDTVTQLQRVEATLLGVIAVRPPEVVTALSTVTQDRAFLSAPMREVPSLIAAALSPGQLINRLRRVSRPSATERLPLR